eukprot:gene6906-14019_t
MEISDPAKNLNANGPLRGRFAALEGLVAWLETEVNTLNDSHNGKITELQRESQRLSSEKVTLVSENAALKSEIVALKTEISQANKIRPPFNITIEEFEPLKNMLLTAYSQIVGVSSDGPITMNHFNTLLEDHKRLKGICEKSGNSLSASAELELLKIEYNIKIQDLKAELDRHKKDKAMDLERITNEGNTFISVLQTELAEVKTALKHPLVNALSSEMKKSKGIDGSGSGSKLGQLVSGLLDTVSRTMAELSDQAAGIPQNVTCLAEMGAVTLCWRPPTSMTTVHQYVVLRGADDGAACRMMEVARVPGSSSKARIECWDVTGIVVFRVCSITSGDVWSAPSVPVRVASPKAVELKFQSPFDEHGVLYFIGSCGGTAPYSNPHTSGLVVASLSSTATDPSYSQPHKFVGRLNEAYCCTDNRQHSFMALDLGPKRCLQPSHYCLKNDGLGIYHVLRHWELQGRNREEEEWKTLRKHEGDTALTNTAYAVADWTLNCTTPFRYFRIYQYDVNSYGAHNIMCCGIELYGTLYTDVAGEAGKIIGPS